MLSYKCDDGMVIYFMKKKWLYVKLLLLTNIQKGSEDPHLAA